MRRFNEAPREPWHAMRFSMFYHPSKAFVKTPAARLRIVDHALFPLKRCGSIVFACTERCKHLLGHHVAPLHGLRPVQPVSEFRVPRRGNSERAQRPLPSRDGERRPSVSGVVLHGLNPQLGKGPAPWLSSERAARVSCVIANARLPFIFHGWRRNPSGAPGS